jgi:hypothetical protein
MAGHPDRRDLADESGDQTESAEPRGVDEDGTRSKPDGLERVRSGVKPEPGRSDRSTKWAVDRLDERERRFSFAASGGALLFGVIVYLVESNAHYHPQKGQLSPQTVLVVGLVGGVLLFGATLLGRRAPVGFVALFTGLAFSNSTLFLALPFLALAIWILYRSFKIQRETSANARAARAESPNPRGSRSPGGTAKSGTGSQKSGTGSTRKGRSGTPTRPEANKRYTPKRPPPPAPKPSRRERKATRASD